MAWIPSPDGNGVVPYVDPFKAAFTEGKRQIMRNLRKRCEAVRVIAIKPKYAKLIYEGKKHWEFRKAPPPLMEPLYIYESAPVCRITGVIVFSSMIRGLVSDVFELIRHNTAFTKNLTGISRNDLLAYAGKRGSVAALRVSMVERCDSAIHLGCKPPQNWGTFYIKKDEDNA